MNPLEILGLEPGAEEKDVEARWLERVSHYQPGQPLEKPGEYDESMEAYLTLLGLKKDFKPNKDGRFDWVPVYIASKREELEGLRSEGVLAEKEVRTLLKTLPGFLSMERLLSLDGFDVEPILREMLPFDEFAKDRDLPQNPALFDVVFRASRWTSLGTTIAGSCKPIPEKERLLWTKPGTVPFWRITLNLAIWILHGQFDRRRLVHHELCHARWDADKERAKGRSHDIEENTATLARFGLADDTQATAIAAAMNHPDVPKMVDAAGWDGGQGLLFAPFRRTKELGSGDPFLASVATQKGPGIIIVDELPGGNEAGEFERTDEDNELELEVEVRRKALKTVLASVGAERLEDVTPKQINQVFDAVKADLDAWGTIDAFVHYVTEACTGLRPTTEKALKAWGPQDVTETAEGGRRRRARG